MGSSQERSLGHVTMIHQPEAASVKGSSPTLLGETDLFLFNEGTHLRLYDKLGAHPIRVGDVDGTYFAVWAPNAEHVSVVGDFNHWQPSSAPLRARGSSGLWEGFVAGVQRGDHYKYHLESHHGGYRVDKADPIGIFGEVPPKTASIVWDLNYQWGDAEWLAGRAERQKLAAPMSIYEVHLGSWMRVPEEGNRSLSYRELAPKLAAHVNELGFTHVELLPVMEHPFYGSWGYQVSGYFAACARYGTPQDLMYLIDHLHQHGIGVILDWVPAHFPSDEHALGFFDGTHLYEHADPRQGNHPDWNSCIFNYGRNEVRSFLLSAAHFWLDRYHIDGLRIDAVASMLYLDYSREEGQWIPNEHGGRENLAAISLLRQLNEQLYAECPGVQIIAEESTAWPMVSRPTYLGGLGFGLKWDMGWMHDTLAYIAHDPLFRHYHHQQLTFRGLYAAHENFVLPLSHDEVVHGKQSLLAKMPGDDWQKFANLRLLYSYMYALNAKKLIFMGGEFGQRDEWDHERSLDWHLMQHAPHRGIFELLKRLNRLYRSEPALHQQDCTPGGFEWIDANDANACALTFVRHAATEAASIVVALNFTPQIQANYRIGVDRPGYYHEVLNSDASEYGGSGQGNLGGIEAVPIPAHGRNCSLTVTLPPLAAVYFKAPTETGVFNDDQLG